MLLRAAAAETRDLTLRLGIEADFFPETVDELREALAPRPFDYGIGSVHFVDGFPINSYARDWEALSPAGVDHTWRTCWARVRRMAESRASDFMWHLDLPRKLGYRPAADLAAEAGDRMDVACWKRGSSTVVTITPEIADLAGRLAQGFRPERVILFGCHARGVAIPESDVDLLVVMDHEGRAVDQAVAMRRFLAGRRPIDLLVRSPAELQRRLSLGDSFLREVFDEGPVLYERAHA